MKKIGILILFAMIGLLTSCAEVFEYDNFEEDYQRSLYYRIDLGSDQMMESVYPDTEESFIVCGDSIWKEENGYTYMQEADGTSIAIGNLNGDYVAFSLGNIGIDYNVPNVAVYEDLIGKSPFTKKLSHFYSYKTDNYNIYLTNEDINRLSYIYVPKTTDSDILSFVSLPSQESCEIVYDYRINYIDYLLINAHFYESTGLREEEVDVSDFDTTYSLSFTYLDATYTMDFNTGIETFTTEEEVYTITHGDTLVITDSGGNSITELSFQYIDQHGIYNVLVTCIKPT
jgi:hypothetical protein